MHGRYQYLGSILLAVAFLAPALTTGCATRSYRVYDPYRNQYHRWDGNERILLQPWVVENHAMAATIADSTAISKGRIGSGAITTTAIRP